MAVLLWLTEAIPAWATSVTIIFVLLFCVSDSSFKFLQGSEGEYGQLLDSVGIMACFADPTIILFLGGFVLAIAATKSGLDVLMAKTMIKPFGKKSENVLLGFILITGIFSMFISNTATAAMMFPIALGLLEAIREMMAQNGKIIDLKNYKYATGLMLMTAYACSIGGVMTPIGTPPNIIMLGFLSELAPQAPTVSFFQWMTWGTVAMIIYFVIAYIVLWRLFPADVKHIEGAEKFISDYVASLGKWTRAQKNTLIAFGVAVFLW